MSQYDQDDPDQFVPVETVADILKVTPRQASRYAERMTTRKAGKRTLYRLGDAQRLADELGVDLKERPLARAEMVPQGEMLTAYRHQQERVDELNQQLGRAAGIIETQERELEQARADRQRLQEALQAQAAAEAQAAMLREELERARSSDTSALREALGAAERARGSAEAEAARMREQISQRQSEPTRPWWRRLFGSD